MASHLRGIYSLIAVIFALVFSYGRAYAGGMMPTQFFTPLTGIQESNIDWLLHSRESTVTSDSPATSGRVLYFGGPVISNVKVRQVFWGKGVDPDLVSRVGSFYATVTNSTYMDWLKIYNTKINSNSGAYGSNQDIGRGSFGGSYAITPLDNGAFLDKKNVEAELVHQFDIGALPKPDADSLYMVDFPPGITLSSGGSDSCREWCGDHEGFTSPKYGNIFYAMIPDLSGDCSTGCAFATTTFDSFTMIASHELIEAITDPLCPDIGSSPKAPAAWVARDQNEVGDLCVGTSAELKASSESYTLQGEWDNSLNGCRTGSFH